MRKTSVVAILFIFLFALSAPFLVPHAVFANHTCFGDLEVDVGIDGALGHPCTPADKSGGGGKILTVEGFMGRLSSIVNSVIPFIVGLTVFVIIWGIFLYVAKADEEEKRSQGRQFILWGVIGVFFMLSVWGFINILLGTFDLKRTIDPKDIPKIPGFGGGNRDDDPGTQPSPGDDVQQ